jgi:hypothetical protein
MKGKDRPGKSEINGPMPDRAKRRERVEIPPNAKDRSGCPERSKGWNGGTDLKS